MYNILPLIGRKKELFCIDLEKNNEILLDIIRNSCFLVIGGAGTIGQATVKEIFKRNPKKLYIVDLSENNLAELVRDLRSSIGYIGGDFKTFTVDALSPEFRVMYRKEGPFDYVLNLSALKHVRSEKDPYSLMRMLQVNNVSIADTMDIAVAYGAKKYFSVSTDKAANPVNLMGATKCIMERIMCARSGEIEVSSARFANVAFSDGSLLSAFNMRLMKDQPIAAPTDIKRYFVTPEESGKLCLMSAILGENRDIFFPQLERALNLVDFKTIAELYLKQRGFQPYECDSEEEARKKVRELKVKGKWPCYFSESNTTGEKPFEEFFTASEKLVLDRFKEIGIIKKEPGETQKINSFLESIKKMREGSEWSKRDIVALVKALVPDLEHDEKGFYLDEKM